MGSEARLHRILLSRYKQFGGLRVVRIYARMGVIWPMIKAVLRNPFSRESYKNAYSLAVSKVEPYLQNQFASMMPERKAYYQDHFLEKKRSNKVWFCWLQGIENAPVIIRACYRSLRLNLSDRDVRLVDDNNWRDYVELPDYIIERWQKKQIPPAHFTDLIRLQLLIKYGGTWIDSTILCTGITPLNEQYTKTYLDADLFMFQYTKPGSSEWGGIGNWFITSCTNNEVLLVLRDMLFSYWKEYDCLINYYIFHLFFSMLRDIYPEKINAMPYGYCIPSITIVHYWAEEFNQEKWNKFTSKVCFHKLTYVIPESVLNDTENYYHYILSEYL